MIICQADRISRSYSAAPIFANLSFQVNDGERIGLVGPNGAGKTSLLRLLARLDAPDSGALTFPGDVETALLAQIPQFPPGRTLLDEARQGMARLFQWRDQMLAAANAIATADSGEDRRRFEQRYDRLQDLLRHHGGYEFDHRIDEVLFGLGFSREDFDRPLATFSGGEQSRALLGKLLLQTPDLMLLDEPTNHLDIDGVEWLEDYLSRQEGAMIIVSHDRYFLDKTVTQIWELQGGRLAFYPGAYRDYVRLRADRQKTAARAIEKQQESLARYQGFVARNKAGQLAKQAKSREKMIARLQQGSIDAVVDVESSPMSFPAVTRTGDIVVSAQDVGKAFDRSLFEGFSIDVERGDRIGIVGSNGAGKTSLLRVLLGQEPPTSGAVRVGHNVRIGYLDQTMDSLEGAKTPLETVWPPWRAGETSAPFRALLARFGIGADLAETPIEKLSGGERTRVALARLASFEHNVLALDEPTNHLDLWGCEALERALRAFDGTVLIVSHDRCFLDQVVDRILYVADGRVRIVHGGYGALIEERAAARRSVAVASTKPKPDSPDRETRRPKRKFPFRKTADIEADIGDREARIVRLEEELQRPEACRDGRRLHAISLEIDRLRRELDQLMEHWTEAMELNPS